MSFYDVYGVTPFVRVNHISDDERAAEINRHRDSDIMTTSPSLMGGYTYPILNQIAGEKTFQILKSDLPSSNRELKIVYGLLEQPETIYGYVNSASLTIVQIEGWDRRATPMSSLGWHAVSTPKTFKRIKTLNRPFRLWNTMGRELRVAVVTDFGYTDMDEEILSAFSQDEIERLLDGGVTISRELFDNCLPNVVFPEYKPDDHRPEVLVNQYRRDEFFRQAQNFHAFNARILGRMHFIGEPTERMLTTPGMIKAEAFVDVGGACERMNVDVICAASALKFEIGSTNPPIILLEPQKAKRQGVNSDLQTMSNLPALYQPDDVKQWTRDFLLSNFERLKSDQVMEAWYDMSMPYFNSSSRTFDQNDVLTLTKWNARAWLMSGRRITESPWLFEQLGSAIAKMIRPRDQRKLRFPVPCAVRAQVISQSFASMAGSDVFVQTGTARWCEELESIVVNDEDWLEMYRSHGGHDLDDFFVGYWRTVGNLRKIILVRSPNDWGEYSMFDYVEGDWYPQYDTYDGGIVQFPAVPTDEKLWPTRLSEMHANGEIIYTGLPSTLVEPESYDLKPYGVGDVARLLGNNKDSASCVGAIVNARVLWSLCKGEHRQAQLASMEDCIDAGTQGGSADDAAAIHAEAKEIVRLLIDDPTVQIDEYMWSTRFASFHGMPFNRQRLNSQSHVSQANRFRNDAAQEFMVKVRNYAQDLIKIKGSDPLIHQLGKKSLRVGYKMLMDTRQQMVRMQSGGNQDLSPRDWGDVHELVLTKLNSYEKISDRHDFIMGLYSACLRVPTSSSGKISDQLVMNPHVFPYLLDAMRFYGMAYSIEVTQENRIERKKHEQWDLRCAQCGVEHITENPIVLQNFAHYDELCKSCRVPVPA